jgi:signal transduction histidine kinase/CheY-like chemotaxis protein/HAMP domain-containing protein
MIDADLRPKPKERARRPKRTNGAHAARKRSRSSARAELDRRELLAALRALRRGEFEFRLRGDLTGVDGAICDAFNDVALRAGELDEGLGELRRAIGREGRTRRRMRKVGAQGGWARSVASINEMLDDLTAHTDEMARVVAAVSRGDLGHSMAITGTSEPLQGDFLKHAQAMNDMVERLALFGSEVTRLAREVGVDGKLGGQAEVENARGMWRDLTNHVNLMASNLTKQVRDIAEVTTAVAEGDLTRKIVVDARGELLELKNTVNTMVDQLSSFADEVTRLASDVGVEGKLGGQVDVRGVSGIWRDLTDAVNSMAANITYQVRSISVVAGAIAEGDLRKKIVVDARGEILELKNTINGMIDQLSSFAEEVTRVARDVGTEGKLGGQASVRGVRGTWKELTDNVNLMASNLTNQVRDIAEVTTAVANGDLSKKITVEVRGELLELKNTINTMVDQLSSFADEVTRVAREVGTEGILGGQAQVRGVSGTWRELTDNVNVMARNLTEQVRGIAGVVTAVANGDLKNELHLEARGEIATLVRTINDMLVTLSTFADQVSGVARDVGVEGRLGGQADVPGAAGVWRDLTNNVNELAGNLTRQVRAIGDVATAVTKGDLTRSIDVEAQGEVAFLKDNINQMIRTLAETTRVNQEQDWLKTNLARFTQMLQGQRDLLSLSEQVLSELAPLVEAQVGAFYTSTLDSSDAYLELLATYALGEPRKARARYRIGESLVGQAARERKRINVTNVPADYLKISSALGEAPPSHLVVVPIIFEGDVKGVIELGSFQRFSAIKLAFIDQLIESLGIVVATIEATMRTDELLRKSQRMAEELRLQQDELQTTNEALQEKARLITTQKEEVEKKNHEVELAKQEIEEKAEQLAVASRYKSEFLANMSHELRTPLNSLLILSKHLSENALGNLDAKQVEYAQTIYGAGSDLLALINEILDLAKIESGTMAIDIGDVRIGDLHVYVERSFARMADEKGLDLSVRIADDVPSIILTDELRLRQVLRNLMSNALKFTHQGGVTVTIELAQRSWPASEPQLRQADQVIAFRVRDTGIGIAPDAQQVIFEAFQQADGSTSRRYGGTGLGLSISREIASLLGGCIEVESEPRRGSVFTLYLPRVGQARHRHSRPIAAPRSVSIAHRTSRSATYVDDDRDKITPEDKIVLIVEDDATFAGTLLERARERGLRGVVAQTGAQGIDCARLFAPSAIMLDLMLPDIDGWIVLDVLKHDPATRHIPVHVVSATDQPRRGLELGARRVHSKPIDREEIDRAMQDLQAYMNEPVRRVLVAQSGDDRELVVQLLSESGVDISTVGDADAAIAALAGRRYDLIVAGAELGTSPLLGDRLREGGTAAIVFSPQGIGREGERVLQELARRTIVRVVDSPELLLHHATLLLHRPESSLSEQKRRMLHALRDPMLAGKRVLVVDDDVRNSFAITAILERYGMDVKYAETGREALERLREYDDIAVVLMDIMMPEMDGLEAIRHIRSSRRFERLPIIALTAKALPEDRTRCLEAGATGYVSKPVDPAELVAHLRVGVQTGHPGSYDPQIAN